MAPPSPWEPLQAWGGLPNVDWCEATVAGWVGEPANTWSNLGYLLAGGLIMARSRPADDPWVRGFGPALLVLGTLSGIYHASVTFVLQVADFLGMFLVTGLACALNLRRLGRLGASRAGAFLSLWIAGFLGVLFAMRAAGLAYQALIAVQALAIVATEARLRPRGPGGGRAWWLTSLALLAAGAACSAADVTRAFCQPHDHLLQGHALWHLLSAASLAALWRFYRGVSFA